MSYDTPNEFMNEWVRTFVNDYSYRNPLYARGVLHVILGRVLVDQKIIKRGSETRPRISLFYLQGASSGKSSALPMIYEVLEELNIEMMSPDELTDAALVGTVEQTVNEEGETVYEDQEGVLSETELFHFDEASVLINPKKYQQNLMTYLQKALNPIGSEQNEITKKMAHGDEITINPDCSLLLTSYMPEGIEDAVLNTGFLQRMICVPRELTIEDRTSQILQDIEALGEESDTDSLEDLIHELRLIKDHYLGESYEFDWSMAKPVIKNVAKNQMIETARDTPREVRKILMSFIPRQIEQMYRLALHYTCMRRDTTVLPKDVREASKIVLQSFHMIVHWLEDNPEFGDGNDRPDASARFRGFREVINEHKSTKNGWYAVPKLMDDLKQVWGISETTCYKWFDRFEDKNWITSRQHGGQKYLKPRGQ